MFAAVLGPVMVVVPAASAGGVLRVRQGASIRPCRHPRPRHNDRAVARLRRKCRPTPRRGVQRRPVAAAPALGASWYQNPVSGTSADPSGLRENSASAGSGYYLYSTGSLFPIQRSTDLVHWTPVGTAFATRPLWVVHSGDWHPWSPNVIQANGLCPLTTILEGLIRSLIGTPSCYFMYYVGLSAQFSTNCVAVATASSPAGPFTDQGPLTNGVLDSSGRPIGCGDNTGSGNIDPAPFVDSDGRAYLYVSTDSACPAGSASCTSANSTPSPTIAVMPLAPNLLQVSGQREPLFSGTQSWERAPLGMVVEGPWMEKRGGVYHLFYSGGEWTGKYGMGDATLSSPLGPATKDPKNPILAGSAEVYSPGGGSTITGPHGGDWMLYHARLTDYDQPRQLFIDPVIWTSGGMPTVKGPSRTPQSPTP
jgi:beta-xylosidase